MDIPAYLLEWAENYLKSKDAYRKEIASMQKSGNEIIITKKTNEEEHIVASVDLSAVEPRANISIITLNNRKNIDHLCQRWDSYATVSPLKIYFINPFSLLEKKWIINPSVHAKICERTSLKLGIVSMFQTVDPITEEIFEKKLSIKEQESAR